jgi:hypothetical protein
MTDVAEDAEFANAFRHSDEQNFKTTFEEVIYGYTQLCQ